MAKITSNEIHPSLMNIINTNTNQIGSLSKRMGQRVSILENGGVGDGSTDNISAYNTTKLAVGSKGIVHFPQNAAGNATYYFSSNPDLTNVIIDADEGVVLSVPSTNGTTFGTTNFKRTIKITSRDRNNTGILPATVSAPDWLSCLTAGDVTRPSGIQQPSVLDATAFLKTQLNTTNDTVGAGLATLTASNQVDWPLNAIGSSAAGTLDVVETPAIIGKEYSASFKAGGSGGNGRGGITIRSGNEWALFSLPTGSSKNWFLGVKKSGVAWSENSTSSLLPSGAYTIQALAQPIISARIINQTTVEFYVNGFYVTTYTTGGGNVQYVGFGWNGAQNSVYATTCYDFISSDCPERAIGTKLNLSIYGDSISFGEGSNLPWPNLLQYALRGIGGVPSIAITNNAVSGQKAADQYSLMQTNGVSGFDYVLVLVGTNDIQSQTAYSSFRTTIQNIISFIKSRGSVPIIGIPPMFIDQVSTGYGFATNNYGQGGIYRQVIMRVCAEQNVLVADVCSEFGEIDALNTQLRDNIHPQPFGDTLIARAFARAIITARKAQSVTLLPASRREGSNTTLLANAMPTSGYWTIGDYVKNTAPSITGTAGSQYVIKGWTRITTGVGNVLNTDWVQDRSLTGS